MLRRFGLNYAIFSMAMDALVVALALALAEGLRPEMNWLPGSIPISSHVRVATSLYVVTPALWVLVFFLFSLYDPRRIFKAVDEFRVLLLGSGFAGLAAAGLLFLSYRDTSRWLFVLFAVLAFGLLGVWRVSARFILKAFRKPAAPRRRVLVVGAGTVGRYVGELIDFYSWTGLSLVGYVDDAVRAPPENGPLLGSVAELREVVSRRRVDELVIALPGGDARLQDIVGQLLDLPLNVRVIPECFTLALDRPAVEDFAGIPMVDLRAGPLSEYQRVAKRLFDLAVSGVATLVALPAMALIALAIKLDSPGPALFVQPRVGENGKVFRMYKFRSMVENAEALRDQVVRRDEAGRVIHKRADDPRVTRVGRLLRRTSLDELPQLFNIVKGDMSLVGPRPELPWLVAQYEPWQRRRLVVPQGLTGWWQVNGRSDKLMHLHTDEDLYYITNCSFWLDLRILWRTFWTVIQKKGAL